MKKIKQIFVMLILANTIIAGNSKFIDLEDNLHPAIKKITQIVIPEFPGAFNGSIIRWDNKILLCFRERDENLNSTFDLGCMFLDEHFSPISTPHILEWYDKNPSTFEKIQDARLIVVKGKLHILFSNFITLEDLVTTRRMFIAHLAYKNDRFWIEKPICIDAPDKLSKRLEKNWVPFIYQNELLLSYSIFPHYVLKPDLSWGTLLADYLSRVRFDWSWGEIRGGTPAIQDGDFYIAFFHSSLLMKSVHSKGKKNQHYVMGAYKFKANPPFNVTHMSSCPIVGKGFYHGKSYPTWKPLHVVFPMGCIIDEQSIWVSYGRQDFELWVVEFDKKKLYGSLVAVNQSDDTKIMYEHSLPSNRE